MAAKRVVILGGGTGGTLTANRLRRLHRTSELEIVVVDGDDRHLYQPGLLFVPFGLMEPDRLVRSRAAQLRWGVKLVPHHVDHVDLAGDLVVLDDGQAIGYDVLVVASGSRVLPEETEGLTGQGWGTRVHTFYTLEGATALRQSLGAFTGGRLVVNLLDLPVKCPVAPLEFCFLADWHLRRTNRRTLTEITYVTSLDAAFTKATCNRELSGLLSDKDIGVVTEFATGEVDGAAGRLVSYDGREMPFDLAVVIPLHGGADFVGRSEGLGDALGFVPVDPATLQSRARENVFAIGDATDVPTSKAGSVAHFEGEILVENIGHLLAGQPLSAHYDGHTNCFIETGYSKALLIDFDYEHEPVTGHFPGRLGLPLLRESRLNHVGKLAFEHLYWDVLLPGRDIPLVGADMPMAGKRFDRAVARVAEGG